MTTDAPSECENQIRIVKKRPFFAPVYLEEAPSRKGYIHQLTYLIGKEVQTSLPTPARLGIARFLPAAHTTRLAYPPASAMLFFKLLNI